MRQFDHEKLGVYPLELRFIEWVPRLLFDLKESSVSRLAEVCDHLDRADLSALLNTAEGNGKRQRLTRAKSFDDARESATECAAAMDALVAKGAGGIDPIAEGKATLIRIISMLCRLVQKFSPEETLREEGIIYRVEDEDEDGEEDE
jgi:four helix bundle protein